MIHVMASIIVKPEHAAAAGTMLVELAATSRGEPGCRADELFQRPDAPNVSQTVEQWRAQADVDRTPQYAACRVGDRRGHAHARFAARGARLREDRVK
jgi:quinol monooxygenase YgiN